MQEKWPELWQEKSWLLHYENAPTHYAMNIRQFMADRNIAVLEQPPYSFDLSPCNFLRFSKLKMIMKGIRFQGVEANTKAVTTELKGIPEKSF